MINSRSQFALQGHGLCPLLFENNFDARQDVLLKFEYKSLKGVLSNLQERYNT